MTGRAARAARAVALVLGTGYVLHFASETVFWSLPPRDAEDAAGRAAGWLVYSLLGLLALGLLRRLRARDGWALLLAGAAFGWLAEGVVAMTLYGDASMPFPLTVAWTALAWHMPLSLALAWYGLGRALRAPTPRPALLLASGLGLFWGVWGYGWGFETPPLSAGPLPFLLHAALTAGLLALAHRAIAWGGPERFDPSRRVLLLAAAPVVLVFALVTVPAVPFSPLVLPPLLGLVLWAMCRGRAGPGEDTILDRLAGPVPARNLATLAVLPLVATAVYSGLGALAPPVPTHIVVAVPAILGGTALFAVALARTARRRPARLPPAPGAAAPA